MAGGSLWNMHDIDQKWGEYAFHLSNDTIVFFYNKYKFVYNKLNKIIGRGRNEEAKKNNNKR